MTVAHVERRVRNGRVSYRARYRDPAGREHGRVFARKVDAQRFLTEMENAKLRGTWTHPALGRVLFGEWFVEWRRTTASLRPNTEARDERLFRLHLLPRFEAMPLARIGQREVRAWVADLSADGLAASTVQRAYQLLSKVMASAVDAGMIPQSPCRRVPLPRIERQEMRFLSPSEVLRLADAIRSDYRALILLGAYGGLRVGEMAGLRRSRVDLVRGTVQVIEVITEPKGNCMSGHPKRGRGGGRLGCRSSFWTPWLSGWRRQLSRMRSCSLARMGVRFGCRCSGPGSGVRRPWRLGWTGCAFMICGIRRWRCGSRPARIPRRSRPVPVMPR
jgi:Phage integrase, N-terminal SAM-like domain